MPLINKDKCLDDYLIQEISGYQGNNPRAMVAAVVLENTIPIKKYENNVLKIDSITKHNKIYGYILEKKRSKYVRNYPARGWTKVRDKSWRIRVYEFNISEVKTLIQFKYHFLVELN